MDHDVPLRVTGHVGQVSVSVGADGRSQPIGSGINLAGAILEVGSDRGIVVSEEFRRAVESVGGADVRFHEPRWLAARNKGEQQLFLMSMPGLNSQWPEPAEQDRVSLGLSHNMSAWETLYHAKRILQVTGSDQEVNVALRQLKPDDFWYERQRGDRKERVINPFLGYLDARALREVIRVGQLVERGYNEVLCRYGDDGNTMFVILTGQVGVYQVEEDGRSRCQEPDFVLRQGQIVGELAFALNRNRTADLVALGDTALLAFPSDDIMNRLALTPGSAHVLERVDQFITARTLEHVANSVPFLIGDDQTGPLGGATEPSASLLEDLIFDSRVVTWASSDGAVTLERVGRRTQEVFAAGLYVLVSGTLTSTANPEKTVRGEDLSLVYVDIPGRIVFPDHEYSVVAGPAKFLNIGQAAIEALPDATLTQLTIAVKDQLVRHYFYDVFISYNFGDEVTVERWRRAFADAGLRVFVDRLRPGTHFTSNIEAALLDSLVLMAFISPHTMTKPRQTNWVRKEIAFREANFSKPWIVPVGLRGADMDEFEMRYTMIDARAAEDQAIETAIDVVRDIRNGREEPPVLISRELRRPLV
jgi:hypothetical protein